MKIAELRSKIEFQQEVETPNATRGVDLTWTTIFKTWAKIEGAGASYTKYQSEEPSTTNTITIRHRSDIVRGMRIHANGINYSIHNVETLDTSKARWMKISVQEEKAII